QCDQTQSAPFAPRWQKQEFAMVLRVFQHVVLLETQARIHGLRLTNLAVFVQKIGHVERPFVSKPLRLATRCFVLPAPANHTLSACAQTLEEYVAELIRKVEV